MGRDKATMPVDGVAMARRVADALIAAGCDPVVAIGGDVERLAVLGMLVEPDRWPGEGPLGAIVAALTAATGPVLVAACDLPWLDASTVIALIDAAVAHPDVDVVHASSPRVEPLCAVWFPSARPVLAAAFAAGERAVHRAMAPLAAHACLVDAAAVANINRPEDLPSR